MISISTNEQLKEFENYISELNTNVLYQINSYDFAKNQNMSASKNRFTQKLKGDEFQIPINENRNLQQIEQRSQSLMSGGYFFFFFLSQLGGLFIFLS